MNKLTFAVVALAPSVVALAPSVALAGGGGPFTDGATLLAHTVGRLIGRLVGLDW